VSEPHRRAHRRRRARSNDSGVPVPCRLHPARHSPAMAAEVHFVEPPVTATRRHHLQRGAVQVHPRRRLSEKSLRTIAMRAGGGDRLAETSISTLI